MKKVFWTSIVWIILIIAFVFYIKWMNQPLAGGVSDFVLKNSVQSDCTILTGEALTEDEIKMKLEKLETHMNTIENLIEIQNATYTEDQHEVTLEASDPEPTDEELFEEFKSWRENNK